MQSGWLLSTCSTEIADSMRGYVAESDVVRVARERPVWRWSQLSEAIRGDKGCCESTAMRAIKRAVRSGLLIHNDGGYQLASTADELLQAPYCYRRLNRKRLLEILAERRSWGHSELMDEVCVRLNTSESTVATSLRYGRAFGYIRHRGDYTWALTRLGREQLALWGRLEGEEGFRFATFLSGHPKRGLARWTRYPGSN